MYCTMSGDDGYYEVLNKINYHNFEASYWIKGLVYQGRMLVRFEALFHKQAFHDVHFVRELCRDSQKKKQNTQNIHVLWEDKN